MEAIFRDVDDAHFAFGALFGIASVGGIPHDRLAELAADRAGGRFGRIGRPEHIANLSHRLNSLVDERDAFFGARLVYLAERTFGRRTSRHELHNVIELVVSEDWTQNVP